MKRKGWFLALALTLPVLAGCGDSTSIEAETAASLQQQVRELATLTQQGDLDAAREQAAALKTEVERAADAGAVTPGRAGRIQHSIDEFVKSIQPSGTTAPTPSTASESPVPAPEPAPPTKTHEDSGSQAERERDAAEEAAEEAQKRAEKEAEEAQKRAEKEAEEEQKREEDERDD